MIKCSVKYVLYQYAEGMIKHSVKVYFAGQNEVQVKMT